MEEIKVGGIVYSPDYGKGRVVEVHKLLGYNVADVGFAGHDQPKTINLVNLSTTKPNDEIAQLRARIAELETERRGMLIDLHDLALLDYLDTAQRRKIYQKYKADADALIKGKSK